MYCTKIAATLIVIAASMSTALASPVRREVGVAVYMYGDNGCSEDVQSFFIEGTGSNRCIPVNSPKGSIQISGDCTVETFSGTNCHGSSFTLRDDQCHSILFGSVHASC